MPGTGTRYHLPLVLQLLQRREEQLAAEAQQNPGEGDPGLQVSAWQPVESVDVELAIEWIGVFFRVFGLALFSGSFLLIWIFALKAAGY